MSRKRTSAILIFIVIIAVSVICLALYNSSWRQTMRLIENSGILDHDKCVFVKIKNDYVWIEEDTYFIICSDSSSASPYFMYTTDREFTEFRKSNLADYVDILRQKPKAVSQRDYNNNVILYSILACWAYQENNTQLSRELFDQAERFVCHGNISLLPGWDKEWYRTASAQNYIRLYVPYIMQYRAILHAYQGEDEKLLLKQWIKICKFAMDDRLKAMAAEYAEGYKELLSNPIEENDRVDTMIKALIDQRSFPTWYSGGPELFDEFASNEERDKLPAVVLARMGTKVIPRLIDIMDSNVPTRNVDYGRGYAITSYHLLTLGECAYQIFERITSEDISSRMEECLGLDSTRNSNQNLKDLKEWVGNWWKSKERLTENAFYEQQLRGAENYMVVNAARQFYRRYPAKAKAVILSIADKLFFIGDAELQNIYQKRLIGIAEGKTISDILHEEQQVNVDENDLKE